MITGATRPATDYTAATLQVAGEPGRTTGSSVEYVYRTLRERIMDNSLPPNTQLLEQALVDSLGVSRTPVREALVRLESEGLLQIIPRHGARVLPISLDDMREIYEILASLEPTAAETLARRGATAEELAIFDGACDRMEAALDRDDLAGWAEADDAYHHHLLDICGNRRLRDFVRICFDQSRRAKFLTMRLRDEKPYRSVREHRAVVDAIRRGDAAAAHDIYRRHRERARDEQLGLMTRYGITQA
jgi:DNA-binding GntR family transcriptional regulator